MLAILGNRTDGGHFPRQISPDRRGSPQGTSVVRRVCVPVATMIAKLAGPVRPTTHSIGQRQSRSVRGRGRADLTRRYRPRRPMIVVAVILCRKMSLPPLVNCRVNG